MRKVFFVSGIFLFQVFSVFAQPEIKALIFDKSASLIIKGIVLSDNKEIGCPVGSPMFSLLIDSISYDTRSLKPVFNQDEIRLMFADSIKSIVKWDRKFHPGLKFTIRFINESTGNHKIENLVPLGEGTDRVYITAGGTKDWPDYLCRSLLFRPGFGPVGVILPDNAWHLGFADYGINNGISLTALARRGDRDKKNTEIDRWAVTLKPGGWIDFNIYLDIHNGEWHEGLKMMFQERWLYDMETFNDSLYRRQDLAWMKNNYIMLLQFAWDKEFYNSKEKKYSFYDSFFEYDSLTGGFDIFTLWPTWPRLGLDPRNQWDMYRDLPGGIEELKKQADFLHKKGKKYFISYNPWDEDTRKENQLKGMENLLRKTNADGVVLDTKGSSSLELQATADRVKKGIIMYSEGMAVPKDMPGIVSGRVHDALVLPPPLNLNKLIKPDFAIFRVLQLADDRIHRELAISFFNGYGVEINTMKPGRPGWIREEFAYLGRTTKILRENNSVFHNDKWIPLIQTLTDSVYVNQWTSGTKMVYTIYSDKPSGYSGPLFETVGAQVGQHYVDLWNHVEINPVVKNGKILIPATIEPFDRSYTGTRREGNAGCIALFPNILHVGLSAGILDFSANSGDKIVITPGNPTYSSRPFNFQVSGNSIPFHEYFDISTEKIVVQLFDKQELIDERIIYLKNDQPVLVSGTKMTLRPAQTPKNMVLVPGGDFNYYTVRDPNSADPFIPLPDHSKIMTIHMKSFYMDQYPVTNSDYLAFIRDSNYRPADTTNYLKHWHNGEIPPGEEDHPVVYISPEDAHAYAVWVNKRLPTETEWQYAAQGNDMRKFPWGNIMDSTKCNYHLNHTTAVRSYPSGASQFGVADMVGNVWQLTNDVYDIGPYTYTIIKGGSYYHPISSIWYVTGGPLPADHPQMLLLISPGLDRNATVGFRCVSDTQ